MAKLAEFVKAVPQSRLLGDEKTMSLEFSSVSTDSRSLTPGALFFALSGPHFDGADFIEAAQRRGAIAAVVTAKRLDELQMKALRQESELPQIEVPDPLLALQQWAHYWRQNWLGRVIAVTGSNGKTTVKQMLAAIGGQALRGASVWATPGNLNNHIGLPLSVLGLQPQHRLAIFELGMNHPGEINILAAIACAQIALVNNAQREHQEFMKSIAAVALENGSVFESLPHDGIAIFPRDLQHEMIWRQQAGARQLLRFGFADQAGDSDHPGGDVVGQWQGVAGEQMGHFTIEFPNQHSIEIHSRGVGHHFAMNCLAAAACAYAAGIQTDDIAAALNHFEAVSGRGQRFTIAGGGTLVDDSYNANPDSVRAAIDALQILPKPQALVLGDMGEVGDRGAEFHEEVLRYADSKNIASLWLHGEAMARAAHSTGIGDHFSELEPLIRDLSDWLRQQQAKAHRPSIWIKGSRFMKMERVVRALQIHGVSGVACC